MASPISLALKTLKKHKQQPAEPCAPWVMTRDDVLLEIETIARESFRVCSIRALVMLERGELPDGRAKTELKLLRRLLNPIIHA